MSAASFLPPVIILSGAFFLIRLRAFFIIHPIRTLGVALRGGELRESVRSLLLALSGTLGVGNILGVAVGISLGGAGSVFWMLLSCLFSSVLKFAEVLISSDTGGGIGMISVIRRTLGR
ncbi:MAG: sodium:alanine symporter family protein, partial [Clostridia bacterium]|nr:sodium:alanine symporter family protein [Clostridia bacterium]